MTQTIHTQLKVSLLDKVSAPMKKVLASNRKLAQQIKKTAKVIEKTQGPLKLIRDLRQQNEALRASREQFRKATERVRELARQMREAGGGTARMKAEYARLQSQVRRAAQLFEQQKQKVLATKRALESAGVSVAHMARAERELGARAAQANRILERQRVIAEKIAAARERFHASLAKHGSRIAGGIGLMYSGRRLLGGLAAPVEKATDFSGAFAGVVKKANFKTPVEEKAFRSWLLKLSAKSPLTAADLADISAAAFEAGIQNIEKNKKFTQMVAKAAVAWEVDTAEAGKRLARVYNAFGQNLEALQAHMDRINHLSNNLALDAGELLNFYSRTHSELRAAGMKSADTAALGSFLIASDFAPEVAATTARNLMKPLVAGEAATKPQREALRKLGLKASDVAKRMQRDAWRTFLDVIERINKLPKHMQAAVARRLFGGEARAAFALFGKIKDPATSKEIAAIEYLKRAHKLVATPSAYAGSAEQEYQTRMRAADMQFRRMRNQLDALSIEIGNSVLPALIELLKTVRPWVESISKLVAEHPRATAAIMGTVAAAGTLAVVFGGLTAAIGALGIAAAAARYGIKSVGLSWAATRAASGLGRLAGAGSRAGRFALGKLVKPIKWTASLIPPIPWGRLAGRLSWSALITPLRWGARFIPYIGWAALAGPLIWDWLIKPLGWDKYITGGLTAAWEWVRARISEGWEAAKAALGQIDWSRVATFGLLSATAEIVRAFTGVDLAQAGRRIIDSLLAGMRSAWEAVKRWATDAASWLAGIWEKIKGAATRIGGAVTGGTRRPPAGGNAIDEAAAGLAPAQKKAAGGWMRAGLPTLVGERGPELIYPARRAWVAHNDNLRRLTKLAAAASVAAPLFYTPPAPAGTAMTASAPGGSGAPVVSKTVHVTVQPGAIQIYAAGMSAQDISEELGRRLAETMRATMADVEDAG